VGHWTLLLPPDSAGQPNRRWPAFYLTSHTDVLVMMPEAGPVGFYANWWNHGAGGPVPFGNPVVGREVRVCALGDRRLGACCAS
jgi:hypothetical protein